MNIRARIVRGLLLLYPLAMYGDGEYGEELGGAAIGSADHSFDWLSMWS